MVSSYRGEGGATTCLDEIAAKLCGAGVSERLAEHARVPARGFSLHAQTVHLRLLRRHLRLRRSAGCSGRGREERVLGVERKPVHRLVLRLETVVECGDGVEVRIALILVRKGREHAQDHLSHGRVGLFARRQIGDLAQEAFGRNLLCRVR